MAIAIMWAIWLDTNNLIFKEKESSLIGTWEKHLQSYRNVVKQTQMFQKLQSMHNLSKFKCFYQLTRNGFEKGCTLALYL